MPILSKEATQALLKKVLSYSKAEECQVSISGSEGANIRYARNSVSTSGSVTSSTLVIASAFGKRQGIVTLNEYSDEALAKAVRTSEELAQLAPENPEFVPFLTAQTYQVESPGYAESTARMTAAERASIVATSISTAKENALIAAGFFENAKSFSGLMNSKGLYAYYLSTNLDFSITMRTADGKGSGYATRGYNDIALFDSKKVSGIAALKASLSKDAKALEPGKYTVILEPAAGLVLIERLVGGLDARTTDEGRSFLSKAGGKTKLGEKIMDDKVTIYSDPANLVAPTAPWTGDGRPQEKTTWIDKGVVKNLYYSRYWAQKQGVKATPAPDAFIMSGGTATLEDLIKNTEKGILVTKLWYIRDVDPQTLLLTGLTRDGTFYIEHGRIKYAVKNFRFNESPIIMLNNLEAMGVPERMISTESNSSAVIPPLKVRDFTFSSLSDAV